MASQFWYPYTTKNGDICLSGSYQQALQCYRQIHRRFPDSVDCLKFLVRLCSDLGLKEVQEYSLKLKKAEKAREARRQVRVDPRYISGPIVRLTLRGPSVPTYTKSYL